MELEKLERKDPLKRLSEKIAIQKTIVNAAVREQSPIRQSPSPSRNKTAVWVVKISLLFISRQKTNI